jgi:2-C-methyl-D-erythritol 4-phosphate cytidylyltransferase
VTGRRTNRCFALIPAAGVGVRAGSTIPKQYLSVAGAPMIIHTIAAFMALSVIDKVVVVVAPGDTTIDELLPEASRPERIVVLKTGGSTRDASVANGLEAMRGAFDDDDWVLVHDAARCGITGELIASLIEHVGDDAVGGLLAVPLDDTVKRAAMTSGDAKAAVAETVDRRGLWRAQTPQMFRYRLLRDALLSARAAQNAITDEASAIEAVGQRALLVPGSPFNFKVTTADDLAMMDALLRDRVHAPSLADIADAAA